MSDEASGSQLGDVPLNPMPSIGTEDNSTKTEKRSSLTGDSSPPKKEGPVFTDIKIPQLKKRRGWEFEITCMVDKVDKRWEVLRKYSDIEEFHKYLEQKFRGDRAEYPQIPPEHKPSFFSFAHSASRKAAINTRLCNEMEEFLQNLMADPISHRDNRVQSFFIQLFPTIPGQGFYGERSMSEQLAELRIKNELEMKKVMLVPNNSYDTVATELESMKDRIARERDLLKATEDKIRETLETVDGDDRDATFATLHSLVDKISPIDSIGKSSDPSEDFRKSIDEIINVMTDLKRSYEKRDGHREKLNEAKRAYEECAENIENAKEEKKKLSDELKAAYQEYFDSIVETKEKVFVLHDQHHGILLDFITGDERVVREKEEGEENLEEPPKEENKEEEGQRIKSKL